MILRPLRPEDIHILKTRATASGYPYPEPDTTELTLVVTTDDGHIITACAAKKLVELYLWPIDADPVAAKLALSLLHSEMPKLLLELGYREAEAFLPPPIAERFGRRLERTFQWVRNWPSWSRRL